MPRQSLAPLQIDDHLDGGKIAVATGQKDPAKLAGERGGTLHVLQHLRTVDEGDRGGEWADMAAGS